MNPQSAVSYRTLLAATIGSPGSGDDLANINTAPLPDGSACFVTTTRQLFRLRKFSSIAAVTGVVIVPIAGGGRWVLEGPVAGAISAFAVATSSNDVDASSTSNWIGSSTAEYSLQAGTGAWEFTASGCNLIYTGPPGRYIATLCVTVNIGVDGSSVEAAVSHNADLTGAVSGLAAGMQRVELLTGEVSGRQVVMAAQRHLQLAREDELQPRFRYSGEAVLNLEALTLSVVPIP